jgi:amino-acid N-acetyltransferase
VSARAAISGDVRSIHALIALYAAKNLLLPRSEREIRRRLSDFVVISRASRVLACASLDSCVSGFAELRSVAVAPKSRGCGLGAELVKFALAEARRRNFSRVFAVTSSPEFFFRFGFTAVPRQSLTEKIERDCLACSRRVVCRLSAVSICLDADASRTASQAEFFHLALA